MLDTELDKLEANPLTVRRMYVACDCNSRGCIGRHTNAALEGRPSKVCPECGDTGEAHYLAVPAHSDGWVTFYAARRGHDDDAGGPDTCEGAKS